VGAIVKASQQTILLDGEPTRELWFGDPAELPPHDRQLLRSRRTDVRALLPWRQGHSDQLRDALVYGEYLPQPWRLEGHADDAERIAVAANDLFNHLGAAIISGYRERFLWQVTALDFIAGSFLGGGDALRIGFAALIRLPRAAVVGRDIRTGSKCYPGCCRLRGNLGLFRLGAEEKRRAKEPWQQRVDGDRALRSVQIFRPDFFLGAWRPANEWRGRTAYLERGRDA
jgi:hypothetical protein